MIVQFQSIDGQTQFSHAVRSILKKKHHEIITNSLQRTEAQCTPQLRRRALFAP